MKQSILIGTVAAVVCFAGFCVGQEGTGSANALPANQKQLKSLAYFLGKWELTGAVNMAGQPTVPFVNERVFKWDLGNKFIQTITTDTENGETVLRHRSMIGWEAKTQRITEWGFWNSNLPTELPAWAETVTWSKDGENWRIEREGVNGLFTIIDQNTHKYECTFKGDDGSKNSWHYTAKRKTATKQVVSPVYEHLKDLEDYLGNWVAEETLNQDIPGIANKGDKLKYRASFRWIQNKAIMQMDFTIAVADGKTISARYLFGWDAGANTIMHWGMDNSGGRDWATLKKEGPDKWIWENKWAGADGTQGAGMDTTTMLDDNNTHVHEYTNTFVDNKSQPDRKVVYKRVK